MSVASAIAPDDFNIFDIAGSLKTSRASQSLKASPQRILVTADVREALAFLEEPRGQIFCRYRKILNSAVSRISSANSKRSSNVGKNASPSTSRFTSVR